MGCNCHNTVKQQKDEMRKRAIKFAVVMEVDVQFHTWTQRGFSRLYDYDEKGSIERGSGVIEIIKFRDHKSKDILPNPKAVKPSSERSEKPTKRGSGKAGTGNKKNQRKLVKNDEPVGKGKSEKSNK